MMDKFEDRMFLLRSEWRTYMRRMPVRRISGKPPRGICDHCAREGSKENPLQYAHRIPFNSGVKNWGLTPDSLDDRNNIVYAHRKTCNKSVELPEPLIARWLVECGVRRIPSYLSYRTRRLFFIALRRHTQYKRLCQVGFRRIKRKSPHISEDCV